MLSSFKPCLNACSATTSLFINASNFVQRYFSMPYLRKLSLHSVVSRILQKRKGHPGDGCRPRHSRRPTDRKESNCTGSCDAEILSHAQMFVQAENRTSFRYYRHKRNTRWQDAAVLRTHMQRTASPSKRRCGLDGCRGAPRARQTASRDLPAGGCAEFRADRATSIRPRSRRRAWGPRCPGRWATCNKRWPRNSPGRRGARARARRAACRPRQARFAAA